MSGALNHSPADIVRYLLIDLSQGTLPSDSDSWPIHVAREPDTPDSVITVFDTSGRLDGRAQVSGEMLEHYGIQVRVRDTNPVEGFAKAQDIAIALDQTAYQDTITINSDTYLVHAVSRTGGILGLGKETPTSKRNLFTINAVVELRQTA